MNVVRNLGYKAGYLLVYPAVGILFGKLFLVQVDCFGIVYQVVYFQVVIGFHSVIYEYICIFTLGLELIHCLNYSWVKLAIILCLHLIDIFGNIAIITSECFFWYLSMVEISDLVIIEFEPATVFVFSVLNERVVMPLVSCSIMDYNSFESIFVIVFG